VRELKEAGEEVEEPSAGDEPEEVGLLVQLRLERYQLRGEVAAPLEEANLFTPNMLVRHEPELKICVHLWIVH